MHQTRKCVSKTTLNRFQFRAHFHIYLLNQAYCCLTATVAFWLLLLLFYRILMLTKRTQTHIHISLRCISLNAISLYRNECASGLFHNVLLLLRQQKVQNQHLLMLSAQSRFVFSLAVCSMWESAQHILPSIANFPFDIFLWMTVARCKLNIFIRTHAHYTVHLHECALFCFQISK